jgi:hypothetical protein
LPFLRRHQPPLPAAHLARSRWTVRPPIFRGSSSPKTVSSVPSGCRRFRSQPPAASPRNLTRSTKLTDRNRLRPGWYCADMPFSCASVTSGSGVLGRLTHSLPAAPKRVLDLLNSCRSGMARLASGASPFDLATDVATDGHTCSQRKRGPAVAPAHDQAGNGTDRDEHRPHDGQPSTSLVHAVTVPGVTRPKQQLLADSPARLHP